MEAKPMSTEELNREIAELKLAFLKSFDPPDDGERHMYSAEQQRCGVPGLLILNACQQNEIEDIKKERDAAIQRAEQLEKTLKVIIGATQLQRLR